MSQVRHVTSPKIMSKSQMMCCLLGELCIIVNGSRVNTKLLVSLVHEGHTKLDLVLIPLVPDHVKLSKGVDSIL